MSKVFTTKRVLFTSLMALLLCFAMFIGTTFAWFTDSVTSANNKIIAGNLDIELYQWTDAETSVKISDNNSPVFDTNALWEPGRTEVVYLSIKNEGNLALKYSVAVETIKQSSEDLEELLGCMTYVITPGAKYGDVTAWAGNGVSVVPGLNATQADDVMLKPGAEHFFAISIHMAEEAGNEYQNKSLTFDVKVLAAQVSYETDSFGDTYDETAPYEEESTPVLQ